MDRHRTTTGLLIMAVLASLGAVLVAVPPWIISQIEAVAKVGPAWTYVYLGLVGMGGAILLGCTVSILWRMWKRSSAARRRREKRAKAPSQLTRNEQEREIAENVAAVGDLQAEFPIDDPNRADLVALADKLADKQTSQRLEIVAFGTISSGKSSLLNAIAGRDIFPTDAKGGTTLRRSEVPWPGVDRVFLVDTPGLGEIDGAERGAVSAECAKDADLVLVVVDGPIRDWEFTLLTRLAEMEKRSLICLNKQDWYDDEERDRLLSQIHGQLRQFVRPEDIISVRSQATRRGRVRVLGDGSQREESVEVPVDIQPLAERTLRIVRRDGSDLLLANLLLQSRGLVEEARNRVRECLDRRAWEIVDKYTWGAGGAAAISPFPLLDLAAGSAISTKMVIDLAHVYRKDLDLDAAVKLIAQLGKNLISILGVSAATPAVATAVASLLKTVPGIGTIAGGFLQGLVQALVTRWIGAVFIGYFRSDVPGAEGGLTDLARREWKRITAADQLRQLVTAAREKISGN